MAWKPKAGLYGGVDAQYSDKIYVNDINTEVAPSYTTISAYTGYVWNMNDWRVNTYARIDNMLDKNYIGSVIVNDGNGRFFEPADGRNWSAGFP